MQVHRLCSLANDMEFWPRMAHAQKVTPLYAQDSAIVASATIIPHKMAAEESDPAAACPVDHKTREAWLKQAQKAQPPATAPAPQLSPFQAEGCDSSQIDQNPTPAPPKRSLLGKAGLGTEREVSTIPRALDAAPTDRPANNEKDTGADKTTGNWIYPSEEMFFNAMKRKSYNPNEADMQTIVPIHNAVNERAWKEIKEWEKGRGSEK
jgi:cytochrome c heme-lyase